MIDLAIENNIKINTVYIGGQNNNELLKNVAERTGGKYFKAVTADELINIYSEIMIDQKLIVLIVIKMEYRMFLKYQG